MGLLEELTSSESIQTPLATWDEGTLCNTKYLMRQRGSHRGIHKEGKVHKTQVKTIPMGQTVTMVGKEP